MANVRTIREYLDASTAPQQLSMRLTAACAVLALFLAALGVYSVMSYVSSQRRHEVAIRMVLGADQCDIVRLILLDGPRLVWIGLAIGVAGALAAGRLMRRFLFDVGAADPIVVGGVVALLATAALVACYLPARWSSRLDPVVCTRL
jgi:ABC-type lipoprotein release transport system permease subunit